MKTIREFEKKHNFLICVDSDGCAMDTMDIKHFRCFGPCMVDEWSLGEWREEILARWNDINLYTMTRGINRFRGLAIALREVDEKYTGIEGIDALVEFAENSPELSNAALEAAISVTENNRALKGALAWSIAVNKAITELPEDEVCPFPLVKDALGMAHRACDVAIVSSANLGAVLEEWEKHSLLPHVDVVMAQDSGSKSACIAKLIEYGYDRSAVIMCGDAPGDLDAAKKNGVHFFPILVRREAESWQEFMDVALPALISGKYTAEYDKTKISHFMDNLKG